MIQNSLDNNLRIILNELDKSSKTTLLEQLLQSHFASYLMQLPNNALAFTNFLEIDRKQNDEYYYEDALDYSKNNIFNPIYTETIEPLTKYYNKYYFGFLYDINHDTLRVELYINGNKRKYYFYTIDNSLYGFLTGTDYKFYVKSYCEHPKFDDDALSAYVITLRAYFMQKSEENQHFQKMLKLVNNPELFTKNYNSLHFIVNEIENRFIRMKEKAGIPRYLYPYMHFEFGNICPFSNIFIKPEQEVLENLEPSNFSNFDVKLKFENNYFSEVKDFLSANTFKIKNSSILIITNPIELEKKIFKYDIPEDERNNYSLLSYYSYESDRWLKYYIYTLYDENSINLEQYTPNKYSYRFVKRRLSKQYNIELGSDSGTFLIEFDMFGTIKLEPFNNTLEIIDNYSFQLLKYHINLYIEQNKSYENMLKEGIEHLILNDKIFGDD